MTESTINNDSIETNKAADADESLQNRLQQASTVANNLLNEIKKAKFKSTHHPKLAFKHFVHRGPTAVKCLQQNTSGLQFLLFLSGRKKWRLN